VHRNQDSTTGFLLQELAACWDQAYEALGQGDLDRVGALVEIADQHLRQLRAGDDLPAALLQEATAARGRLEHGMRSGLEALQAEMSRARKGEKALRGYGKAQRGVTTDSGLLT